MSYCCEHDDRRDAVRVAKGRVGLDFVELSETEPVMQVYFLGDLPPELAGDTEATERFFRVDGGERIRDIKVIDVDPVVDKTGRQDPYLLVRLDRTGDFSTYTLRLVDVADTDPQYDHVDFVFHLDCPRDLDCVPSCVCAPAELPEPPIDYLAKDYASFRQLILDRLSVLMPDWTERHVPDLGIALVELLAYMGDYLSYYQDAVATEAYLDTARERISVRRHVRLVDYRLHEGCNARAWVCMTVSQDQALDPADMAFVTSVSGVLAAVPTLLSWESLRDVPSTAYEVFEPVHLGSGLGSPKIQLRAAHNEILFYAWGNTECCLEQGSTWATLVDSWEAPPQPGHPPPTMETTAEPATSTPRVSSFSRPAANTAVAAASPGPGAADATQASGRVLDLHEGDVLIFEEVIGPKTDLPADADPTRRHAVRLTKVTPGEDPVALTADGRPMPIVEIEWGPEDALPFTLCLSTIGPSPACRYLDNVSVAHGNVILVSHGRSTGPEDLGSVPTLHSEAPCECADHPGDVETVAGPYSPQLGKVPLTFAERLPRDHPPTRRWTSAARLVTQDAREALPQVALTSVPSRPWEPRYDLIESGPDDPHFVVEIDNDGVAHLRFGNGELGTAPGSGMSFSARYRTGNGPSGNVGAESISHLVLATTTLHGIAVTVRNPLPAVGGTLPEPAADAKLYAPHVFRKRIERAITAGDYAELAQRNPRLQRAGAALTWTGSWYEADVVADPLGSEVADEALLRHLERYLYEFRRIGHDLRTVPARYVALDVAISVCAAPHFQRAHVRAALLDRFSNRILAGGERGFFHPDNLTFGGSIFVSKIVAAAQAVPGVTCAEVTKLQRRFQPANRELKNGVLPIRSWEIAQLDNDGNQPERGLLEIDVNGDL